MHGAHGPQRQGKPTYISPRPATHAISDPWPRVLKQPYTHKQTRARSGLLLLTGWSRRTTLSKSHQMRGGRWWGDAWHSPGKQAIIHPWASCDGNADMSVSMTMCDAREITAALIQGTTKAGRPHKRTVGCDRRGAQAAHSHIPRPLFLHWHCCQ